MLAGFDPQDSATRIGRYLTSGSPDGAFGTDGVVVSGQKYVAEVLVRSDDKIVLNRGVDDSIPPLATFRPSDAIVPNCPTPGVILRLTPSLARG